jgi:EpsD family peptidyl-prolyl cis-trans isomerase
LAAGIGRLARVGLAVALTAALCACKPDAPAASTDTTQIAAQVNKGELSVHQVRSVLQRQPRLLADRPESAAPRVLEVLIDQELASQAAHDHGFDKEPDVVQALEAARREVFARTYHDRIAAQATKPSSDEIDRYFEEHPSLFAQRRLYVLQEFAFEATPDDVERLKGVAARARSVAEVADALRLAKLSPRTRQFVQAAEDLPLAMLDTMARLDTGGSLLLPQAGGARIFTVLHAQSAPIELRVARPAIEGFLISERQRKAVGDAMTELRRSAKIEYRGEFAKKDGAAPTAAPDAAASR